MVNYQIALLGYISHALSTILKYISTILGIKIKKKNTLLEFIH